MADSVSDDELSWDPVLERAREKLDLTVIGGDSKKRLYLCFGEYKRCGEVFYSIQATNLREDIHEVAYKSGKGFPVHKGCGVYGSKIVFIGGVESIYDGIEKWDFAQHPTKDVYVFETDPEVDPTPKIISWPSYELFNYSSLRRGKNAPIIREHDKKLFVLSTYPMRFAGVPMVPAFEVFDTLEGEWKSLPNPPPFELLYNQRGLYNLFSYLILGSNIFVSSGLSHVFRFDMADPANGWQPHKFDDCDRLPLEFTPKSLAVECVNGDWVILNHDPSSRNLPVHLISKDLKRLKTLAPLRLPHPFSTSHIYGERYLSFYSIFHIEGQKVGLVVAVDANGRKYRLVEDKCWPSQFAEDSESDSDLESHGLDGVGVEYRADKDDDWADETLHRPIMIFVVTFEFELQSCKNAIYITFKDLDHIQTFMYDAHRPSTSDNTEVEMLQAFWL